MPSRLITIAFIFAAALLCMYNLAQPELTRWDESTNALVIHDTAETKSWPWLQFDGGPFLEKPPLWYWITGATTSVFGWTPLTLRLPAALLGLGVILLTIGLARQWFGQRASWMAGLFMLSSPLLFVLNPDTGIAPIATHTLRTADSDSLLIVLLLLAVALIPTAHQDRWKLPALCLLSGLAVLTKGPWGIVPPLLALAWWMYDPPSRPGAKSLLLGIGTFMLTTLPWHLVMALKYGASFWQQYIGYHLIDRVTTALETHSEPWWFYLHLLTSLKFVPLGLFSLVALAALARRWKRTQLTAPHFLTLIGALLLLLIPTLTQTKLAWYLLPALPFLALALGAVVGPWMERLGRRRQLAIALLAGVFGLLTLSYSLYRQHNPNGVVLSAEVRAQAAECSLIVPAQAERLHRYFTLRLKPHSTPSATAPVCRLTLDERDQVQLFPVTH